MIDHWYYTCAPAWLEAEREAMTTARQPWRRCLQALRQSLQEAFKGSEPVWLKWVVTSFTSYLARKTS